MDQQSLSYESEVMEFIRRSDPETETVITELQKIVMDRSIPESQKVYVKKALNELIRLKTITEKLQVIVTDEEFERWCKS